MLTQFLNEVETVLLRMRAGKRFPKYRPSEVLAPNEKKVGTITDWWRKALYIAFRMRCTSIEQLMSAPGAQMDAEHLNRLADEKSALVAMVFGELRSIFGSNVIGVRRKWVVAAMASDTKPVRKPKRKRKPNRGEIILPKDYLPGNLASCGNPACKICPGHKIPLPPRPPGDRIVT
jgi:hypothetical protein